MSLTAMEDCVPATCADLGLDCGTSDDGCGSPLECSGYPEEACAPLGRADLGAACEGAVDICGNAIDCGPCPEEAPAAPVFAGTWGCSRY